MRTRGALNPSLAAITDGSILPRRMLRSPFPLLLGLLVLLAGGCSRPGSPAAGGGTDGAGSGGGTFPVATAVLRPIERGILVAGSLLAVDRTPVSVKVPGRLGMIAVDLGSAVRAGDLIARIESADYELRLRQAEAALAEARARVGLPLEGEDDEIDVGSASGVKQARAVLDEAEANRDRILALTGQGILSTAERETATAAFRVASSRYEEAVEGARMRVAQLRQRRAEYAIARKQLEDTAVRAPFDGAVQERRANVGEYLTTGAPVVVLVRTDPLRLRVEVSERDAHRVKVGQPVRVSVEGDDQVYAGEVRRLSPAIVEGSRTLVVEADVPSRGRLRPGSFARSEIVTVAEIPAVTIAPEAVVTFAGIEKVFLVEDGRAVERRIRSGDRGDGWVEVTEGLKGGETIVLRPGNLQTGQAVRAAPATLKAGEAATVEGS